MLSAIISISGISLWHFWIGLCLLGVGWNFAFVGATTMVTAVPPAGRAQQGSVVQRLPGVRLDGDRLVLVRHVLANFGWNAVNNIVFPVILTAAALLLWQVLQAAAEDGLI